FMDLVAWKMAFDAVRTGQTNSSQNLKSGKLDVESRAKAAPGILGALKPLDERFNNLRTVSARPYSRYPVVYNFEAQWGILLPHRANIKGASERLKLRACAELAAGQSGPALDDVKLILLLGDSLQEEPFLISYLVRAAVIHIAVQPVWEGLAEQRWS